MGQLGVEKCIFRLVHFAVFVLFGGMYNDLNLNLTFTRMSFALFDCS